MRPSCPPPSPIRGYGESRNLSRSSQWPDSGPASSGAQTPDKSEVQDYACRDADTRPSRYRVQSRQADLSGHRDGWRTPANTSASAFQGQDQGDLKRRHSMVEQLERSDVQPQPGGGHQAQRGRAAHQREHAQNQTDGHQKCCFFRGQFSDRGAEPSDPSPHWNDSPRSARRNRKAGRTRLSARNWTAPATPASNRGLRPCHRSESVCSIPSPFR